VCSRRESQKLGRDLAEQEALAVSHTCDRRFRSFNPVAGPCGGQRASHGRQTWALGLLASLCFALLFWRYRPIAALEMHHHGEGVNVHLFGMWLGFAIAALLVAMFSGRISSLLRQHEQSLLRMQGELARKDRLASLVTLAAGAAHELGEANSIQVGTSCGDYRRLATKTPDLSGDCAVLPGTSRDHCCSQHNPRLRPRPQTAGKTKHGFKAKNTPCLRGK
jgi:hypothetical protein